jgi:hypothetical protein
MLQSVYISMTGWPLGVCPAFRATGERSASGTGSDFRFCHTYTSSAPETPEDMGFRSLHDNPVHSRFSAVRPNAGPKQARHGNRAFSFAALSRHTLLTAVARASACPYGLLRSWLNARRLRLIAGTRNPSSAGLGGHEVHSGGRLVLEFVGSSPVPRPVVAVFGGPNRF